MGRSGGGGGGSHSSGGGFSHSSHSSSSYSHSSHSSSRSSSRSSSSRRPSGGPYFGGYRRTGGYTHIGPTYIGGRGYGYGGVRRAGCLTSIVSTLIVVIVLCVLISALSNSSGKIPESTVNRERLVGGSFTADCVDDELGWLADDGRSESWLGGRLQKFWDATGVQPYVILVPYDASLSTSEARYNWADGYFADYINRNDAMLLVYFDDEPDGTWEMVCGNMTGTVLDAEAKDIFWGCLDRYWNDLDYTVPEALDEAFETAGERIMTKTTTGMDVMKYVVIGVVIIAAAACVIFIMKTKRKHEAEENAETARILNTPLEDMTDNLVDKYSDDGGGGGAR